MVRRFLNLVVALGLVAVAVVAAARVAEPSVRPVLYPPSASPATTTSEPPAPSATSGRDDSVAIVSTTVAPTATAAPTTVVPSSTTVPATTTEPQAVASTTTEPVDEEAVLMASYVWGPSAEAVLLQSVLGIEADGWYGPATREAHLAENAARGLPIEAVPAPPTTTTTTTTTVAPATTTTLAAAAATTLAPTTTAPVSATTTLPPSTTAGMFGGLGAKLVAQLLGQPCIADGDLSDCGPEVDALVRGLVG